MFMQTMKSAGLVSAAVLAAMTLPGCRGTGRDYSSGDYGTPACGSCQTGAAAVPDPPAYARTSQPDAQRRRTVPAAVPEQPVYARTGRAGGCSGCKASSEPPGVQAAYASDGILGPATSTRLPPVIASSSPTAGIQRTCPVTGAALGSMGAPAAVTLGNKTVYVCCAACSEKVKQRPEMYLARVEAEVRGAK